MKFSTAVLSAVFVATVSSVPVKRAVDPALVPQFGFTAGKNPTGTGDCDGAVNGADGKPIKIPCSCPPDRQAFIDSLNANVAAGKAVNNPSVKVQFPTDNSPASQSARLQAATVTLQNLNGPGKGCPVVSTTFGAQQKAIQGGGSASAAAAAPAPASSAKAKSAKAARRAATPASVPPSAAAKSAGKSAANPAAGSAAKSAAGSAAGSAATTTASAGAGNSDPGAIDSLTPQFGVTPGQNPTGTGDCDGVNGVKIPCSCPPDRQTFLKSLQGNIAAGKATNNPSVAVQFPTDNSAASQRTRIQASLVTLQNLNGPGKGCPAASTTFSAQLAAVQG